MLTLKIVAQNERPGRNAWEIRRSVIGRLKNTDELFSSVDMTATQKEFEVAMAKSQSMEERVDLFLETANEWEFEEVGEAGELVTDQEIDNLSHAAPAGGESTVDVEINSPLKAIHDGPAKRVVRMPTREELLKALETRLIRGEISESLYKELKAKLEANLSGDASPSAGEQPIGEGNVIKDESLRAEAERKCRAEQEAAEAERRAAMRPSALELDCGGRVMLKLELIPAGEFLMGSGSNDPDAFDEEKPQHRVTITKPFYMGICPVTQAQYRAVTGKPPSRGDFYPAIVTWFDAQKFCELLSARVGRKVRLPTEAEWEYACRAGTTTRFSFGDDASELRHYGWCDDDSDGATHPVGQKIFNNWGLYDMHGNVWEWCSDWYSKGYANAGSTDPLGPASGSARVLRGGSSYYVFPGGCRSASRYWADPEVCYGVIGFRVVVDSD